MKNLQPAIKLFLKLLLQLLFWVGIYFFYTYFLGYGSTNTEYVNKFSTFLMPVTIAISYFFLLFLIPKYLLEKKYGLFILYSIYTIVISIFLIILSILYGLVFLVALNSENTAPLTKTLPFIILGIYMVVLMVSALGLVYHTYKTSLKNEDLERKFLQSQLQLKEQELKFLKMQIHPHFLFNSLNTIYGFAIKKADEAPKMILKLSNLLDYILYQIDKPWVHLEEEIHHLEDYISLEQMRFHDSLDISFQKENEQPHLQIAPMLLIPFVENSFKHGAIINDALKIDIRLKTANNTLLFEIENSTKNKKKPNTGIGLENIKRRLEFLYPNKYQLKINKENAIFKVSLQIEFDTILTHKNE